MQMEPDVLIRVAGIDPKAIVERSVGERSMKRSSLVLLSALALSIAEIPVAVAQPRPDTLARSCAASRALVDRSGAIVLGTGPYIYDRFVRDRRFCQFDEYTEPAWVQSRDTPQCFVGYRCKTGSFWDW